ncbi:MAG: DMT family transporter [Chloroflexi bacterium]|nr:DMT family transporter [Chloroflexota bacterium]
MDGYLGELAGLGTSLCWSVGSVFFTLSGRRVGSAVVNRTRLLMALVLVSLLHLAMEGRLLPIDAGGERWFWMGLSGLIGFVIGDAMLFQAFVMIGPRLSMLLMALAPVMGAVLAWPLLGEHLTVQEILGILLALSGVAWVVADRGNSKAGLPDMPPRFYAMGVLFGLGGALGQAGGLIASKVGLEGDYSALSGNVMRLVVSTIVIWLIAAGTGRVRSNFQSLQEQPRAIAILLGGAIFGPVMGVWLSLVAVQNAPVGIASTLMSFPPIILLPIAHYVFKEHITWRAVAGTALAVAGTAVIFLAA